MSLHVRHVIHQNSPRIQIRFRRTDLLYKTDEVLTPPNGRLTIQGLPLYPPKTRPWDKPRAVGPTLADMLVRELVRIGTGKEATEEIVWRLRPLSTLWPDPRVIRKEPVEKNDKPPKAVDHPFQHALASGGTITDEDAQFVKVEKFTTITIADYAFKLAVGMAGDIDRAHAHISNLASAAWDSDLVRARMIFDLVQAANGRLIEDEKIEKMRPASSISQEVEAQIMRECCAWLGVKPDGDMRRSRGRPGKKEAGDEGEVIRVKIDARNRLSASTKKAYHSIAADADLATLNLLTLIELLGQLRTDSLDVDADLLEAFLDASVPDWRDQVADDDPAKTNAHVDPYEVLGVARDSTMEEVRRAYKKAMQRIHPDTSGLSRWFSQMVADAYRSIRTERGEQ